MPTEIMKNGVAIADELNGNQPLCREVGLYLNSEAFKAIAEKQEKSESNKVYAELIIYDIQERIYSDLKNSIRDSVNQALKDAGLEE